MSSTRPTGHLQIATAPNQGLPEKPVRRSWCHGLGLFLVLCCYRTGNALLVQTQFDPDEYWQTLEPAYCIVFSGSQQALAKTGQEAVRRCAFTWEWTRRWRKRRTDDEIAIPATVPDFFRRSLFGPVRSFLALVPTIAVYRLLRMFHMDTRWAVARGGPLVANAVLVAAPTDWAVWYISGWMSDHVHRDKVADVFATVPFWSLFASLTSWFHGYALVRTYSNSMETSLLLLGMALLSPELFGELQSKGQQHQQLSMRGNPSLRTGLAFVLGGMSVAIRFSAVTAWVPLGLAVSFGSRTIREGIWYCLRVCVSLAVLGIFIAACVDRCFYGFWTLPVMGSLYFNVFQGNGSLYGTHPLYWYLLVGIPVTAGVLLPFFVADAVNMFRTQQSTASESRRAVRKVLYDVILPYVAFHSVSAHKEYRFMLPIIPMISILSGHFIATRCIQDADSDETSVGKLGRILRGRKLVICSLLVTANFPLFVYLATVHQNAPVEINRSLASHLAQVDFATESIQHRTMKPGKLVTVHYLLGCHSTPLYSHLHLSGVSIDAWTLDCSPSCRANPDVLCESDRFHSDPAAFIELTYGAGSASHDLCEHGLVSETCVIPTLGGSRPLPNFVVTTDDVADNRARDFFRGWGFVEVGRVPHAIRGIDLSMAWETAGLFDVEHFVVLERKGYIGT